MMETHFILISMVYRRRMSSENRRKHIIQRQCMYHTVVLSYGVAVVLWMNLTDNYDLAGKEYRNEC